MVTGLPPGSTPLSKSETEEILQRWEGPWKLVPLPPMMVKGPASKSYVEYTDAFVSQGNMMLSGGSHMETHQNKGTARSTSNVAWGTVSTTATMSQSIVVPNETIGAKLIFFRAPDGTLYGQNVGGYVISETPQKIELSSALGYPMTLYRDAPAQNPPSQPPR
jgi:hypothetical protein